MKKKYLILIVFILCISSLYAQEINFYKGSFNEVLKEAKSKNKNIFVTFSATWCGPCKALAKDVYTNNRVIEKYNKEYICYKVMSEDKEFKSLSKEFKITGFPTLLYLSPNKKELYRKSGYVDADRFIKMADLANGKALTFKELYKKHKKNPKDLKLKQNLLLESIYEIRTMRNKKEKSLWIERMTNVFSSYFKEKPKKELLNKNDLNIILQFHQKVELNDDIFDHLAKYVVDYTKIIGDNSVVTYIVNNNCNLIITLSNAGNKDYLIPLKRINTDLNDIYKLMPILNNKCAYEIFKLMGKAYYSLATDKDQTKFIALMDEYYKYMEGNLKYNDYQMAMKALYKNCGKKIDKDTDIKLISWFKNANKKQPNLDILIFMSDCYHRLEQFDNAKKCLNEAVFLNLATKNRRKQTIYNHILKQKLSQL